MAELLVLWNAPAGSAYERGDLIEVYPDGRCTEAVSAGSPYVVVKIPDVTVARAQQVIQAWLDAPDANGDRPLRRPRKHRITLDTIPTALKNALTATRTVTVTKAQLAGYLRDKDGDVAVTL